LIIWGTPSPKNRDIFVFDIEKQLWKGIKPRGQFYPRKGHSACLHRNDIIIFGGQQLSQTTSISIGYETGVLSIKDKDRNLITLSVS